MRRFEEQIQARLKTQFDIAKAGQLFVAYQATRDKLINNVIDEIKGAQPDLSDHGVNHIANVMSNAYHLLAEGDQVECLSGVEMYCLGMMILFHDVGNLYGRKDHHKKIAEVFDWARGTDASIRHEKSLVLAAARAHTGIAADGSMDALRDVSPQEHLLHEPVRLQQLAAVLRFADELAEGPQRTSEYMLVKQLYKGDNKIYHDYASITHVFIDRGEQRVVLTYEIEVTTVAPDGAWQSGLRTLLPFIYHRVTKLDQERRYARFYSDLLGPFKATSVKLNFHWHGQPLELNQPEVKLDDKVIPGDAARGLPDLDASYNVEALLTRLAAQAQEVQS